MLKKLQRKFVLLSTIIFIVVMLLIALAINIVNYTSVINNSDDVLNLLIENDMKLQENQIPAPHIKFSKEIAYTTRFFIVKTDLQGQADVIDTKNISFVSPSLAQEYVTQVATFEDSKGIVDDFRYVEISHGNGYTYIFLDIEENMMNFYSFMGYSILVLVVALILIFIALCILSKNAVSPIAQSYQRQKRFITDVSHEFKTPLAIIKADKDVIEMETGESEWTQSVESQIKRLNNLVESLVSLTKLDEFGEKLEKVEFSLSNILNETCFDFLPTLQMKNLKYTLAIEENIMYLGQEREIQGLFTILIENAIKYSLNDTNIKISLKLKSNKKILEIENECENVEIGKHNEWFERFYREDKARSGSQGGFGIGLSIAKTICDRHKAKISAYSKDNKNVLITVVL